MGFKTQSEDEELISEINVTPMVDVMLVLLVIFMISAPLLFSGIPLNLPKTKAVQSLKVEQDQIVISITDGEKIYLGEDLSDYQNLPLQLAAVMDEQWSRTVFVRAEKTLPYGQVARLLSFLRHLGVTQLSLVTESDK